MGAVQGNMDIGPFPVKFQQRLCELPGIEHRPASGNAEAACLLLSLQLFLHAGNGIEYAQSPCKKMLSFLRKDHFILQAEEKHDAEFFFQKLYLIRYGALRPVHLTCGVGNAAARGDVVKTSQLLQEISSDFRYHILRAL